MKLFRLFLALMFVPLLGWAQGYRNLDEAAASLNRGFESGDAQAIVAGISEGDQVQLSFPGLVEESGFFGRDQASYLLENLFSKVKSQRFERVSARKNTSEGQYTITAAWTINRGGESEERNLIITLRNKDDRWSLASIRSSNR